MSLESDNSLPGAKHEETSAAGLPGWGRPLDCYVGRGTEYMDLFDMEKLNCFAQDRHVYDEARNWRQLRFTRHEITMINMMDRLTDKPRWYEKINDMAIRERWTREVKDSIAYLISEIEGISLRDDNDIIVDDVADEDEHGSVAKLDSETSRKKDKAAIDEVGEATDSGSNDKDDEHSYVQFEDSHIAEYIEKATEFVIKELVHKAGVYNQTKYCTLIGVGGADVVKSDTIIPEDWKIRFRRLAGNLEKDPTRPVDWHPGYTNVVRNLVHPSLYPLWYGHSTIISDEAIPLQTAYTYSGLGKVLKAPEMAPDGYSKEFQWLPTEVGFTSDKPGGGVHFKSYINNLEWPRHSALYTALEELVGFAIPLWNRCIAVSIGLIPRRIVCNSNDETWRPPMGPISKAPDVYEREDGSESNLPERLGNANEDRLSDDWEVREHQDHWEKLHRLNAYPPPVDFNEHQDAIKNTPQIDLVEEYRNKGLQVIVKMASIHLTPENPRYEAGSWHVEGLANEHICATAIYYYDSENIESSALSFRAGAMLPHAVIGYEQFEFSGLEHMYGTALSDMSRIAFEDPDGEADTQVQSLGTVSTPDGRLLAFPNVFHHCVTPFELADKTKPGHRKIAVLWLVNPDRRIISTAHVPPQQRYQCQQLLRKLGHAKSMPPEVCEMIARSNTANLPHHDEARKMQVRLMEERSVPGSAYGTITYTYNFCEH